MLCGIDEAGRGCLAGSLAVAGVILENNIKGLTDSKKVSPKKRELLYEEIIKNARYKIILTDSKTIDQIGLSQAIKESIIKIVKELNPTKTIMDGNTTFGISNIESMIKADDKILEVSAASILAKVSRDRLILKLSKNYPQYQFEKHKGYGTKLHIAMIKEHGRCELHRYSFKIKGIDS